MNTVAVRLTPGAVSDNSLQPRNSEQIMKITVEKFVRAPGESVWKAYTTPEDIVDWNAASEDWRTTKSSVDLRVGGEQAILNNFARYVEAKV